MSLIQQLRKEEEDMNEGILNSNLSRSITEQMARETEEFFKGRERTNFSQWRGLMDKYSKSKKHFLSSSSSNNNNQNHQNLPSQSQSQEEEDEEGELLLSEERLLELEELRQESFFLTHWSSHQQYSISSAFCNQRDKIDVEWSTHFSKLDDEIKQKFIKILTKNHQLVFGDPHSIIHSNSSNSINNPLHVSPLRMSHKNNNKGEIMNQISEIASLLLKEDEELEDQNENEKLLQTTPTRKSVQKEKQAQLVHTMPILSPTPSNNDDNESKSNPSSQNEEEEKEEKLPSGSALQVIRSPITSSSSKRRKQKQQNQNQQQKQQQQSSNSSSSNNNNNLPFQIPPQVQRELDICLKRINLQYQDYELQKEQAVRWTVRQERRMVGQIDGMKSEKQTIGEWKESQEIEIRRFLINHHSSSSLGSNGKRKTQNLQQEEEEEEEESKS